MASGPQPAVEGSSAGSNEPSRTQPGSSGAIAPRTVPLSRPGEPSNGSQAIGYPTRNEPRSRSSAPPSQRPPTGPSPAAPPVGRATTPDRRESRSSRRHDPGPRVVAARRTRRVVRKIDVWTVLKMSLLFYLCVFLVFLIAGVLLWNIAEAFNVITNVEKFVQSLFDLASFTFRPMVVLEASAGAGGILVLLGTGANVLAALLYNLISDVVGGVQFIILEEAPASSDVGVGAMAGGSEESAGYAPVPGR